MENLLYPFSCLFSCIIVIWLVCWFCEKRYTRAFENPLVYRIVQAAAIALLTVTNLKQSVVWNIAVNILIFGGIGCICYQGKRKYHRLLEMECLLLVLALIEGLGGIFLFFLVDTLGLMPENKAVKDSLQVISSKLLLIFLYYMLLKRFQKGTRRQSRMQSFLLFIMYLYSIFNFTAVMAATAQQADYFLLYINLGCIIFANLYLLYFLQMMDEKKDMEIRIAMMKQQEELQFDYYEAQQDKYQQSIAILHDVSRHIRSIEELYRADKKEEALAYTKQIGGILAPLLPREYSDNPMLNIILADKSRTAKSFGISFTVSVESGKLDFIEPVDVTTLFGNLLDNAIEACKKCGSERYIQVYIRNYNEMISIRIVNSVEAEVKLKNGRPVSTKESGGGIGSLNVEKCVEKYGGSVLYKNADGRFYSNMILNRY